MKQVAIQFEREMVEEIDRMAASEKCSRAEVIRTAVEDWLARQREIAIDAALAQGYGERPPGSEEVQWAERSVEALAAADLDW